MGEVPVQPRQDVPDVVIPVLESTEQSVNGGGGLPVPDYPKSAASESKSVQGVGSYVTDDVSDVQDAADGDADWLISDENVNIDVLIQFSLRHIRSDNQQVQSGYRSLRDSEARAARASEVQAADDKKQSAFDAKEAAYTRGITSCVQGGLSAVGGALEVAGSRSAYKTGERARVAGAEGGVGPEPGLQAQSEKMSHYVRAGNSFNQSLNGVGQGIGGMASAQADQSSQLWQTDAQLDETESRQHDTNQNQADERRQSSRDFITTAHDVAAQMVQQNGETGTRVATV
jgi:hypothetical protein